jgi:hypothetical protein
LIRVFGKLVLAAVALGVGAALVVTTSATALRPNTSIDRVRVFDPVVQSAFDRGVSRSPTLVRMVAYLQHSDLIVYLARGTCPGRHVVGCVAFVRQQGEYRYLRINFVLLRQGEATALMRSPVRLAAQIGHELQHAVEIADEPSVVDGASLGRMYVRKGAHVNDVGYETDAALEVADTVLREVTQHVRIR